MHITRTPPVPFAIVCPHCSLTLDSIAVTLDVLCSKMDFETNEFDQVGGKRLRDEATTLTNQLKFPPSSFASFVISQEEEPMHIEESYCTPLRKRARVGNEFSPVRPVSLASQSTRTTRRTRSRSPDENKPPADWWRQRPRRNEATSAPSPHGCFLCSKTISEKRSRAPLKPNTLLNYFSATAPAASRSHPAQPQPSQSQPHTTMDTCSFCDRSVCSSCTRQCQGCQENFCTLCSTLDYTSRAEERSFCLDCFVATDQQQQQPSSGEDAMQID